MDKPIEYDNKRTLIINRDLTLINEFDLTEEAYKLYFQTLDKLAKYNQEHLTTKALASYIIQ
jgi:hypothetical protein